MRKQYHFRRINQQLYIWDVDRLISLTQNILPKKIPLSAIRELNEPHASRRESIFKWYISIHAYQLKKLPEPDFIDVDPQDLPYEDDNLIL